uniref:Venom protein Ci-35b n=1 Tax=Chelonus inanitus TaxID=49201 RepID=E6ZCJ7_9HYME|nr:venom protein Ci-35b [Chelonus inanitus]
MKFLLLFATGFYLITNKISANEKTTTKKCGGLNTEVIIKRKLNRTMDDICFGQQIHSHAVIIPAYCVEGIPKTELKIETNYKKPVINTREVLNIFSHPSYSHCVTRNDLAILVFEKAFDAQYDKICIEPAEAVDSDESRKCKLQLNSYTNRNKHFDINGVPYGRCKLTKDHVLAPSGKYYTEFRTCSYHPNKRTEVIKTFYEYRFWGYEYSEKQEKSDIIREGYKLFQARDWIDKVLQYAIPISLNNSLTSKQRERSFDGLNIRYG